MEGSADLTGWLAAWGPGGVRRESERRAGTQARPGNADAEAAAAQAREAARAAFLDAVYPRLRRLARSHLRAERRDHSLAPTALVHEAYLKLIEQTRVSWRSREHFFATAAHVMRRILVDHARTRAALKRGAQPRHARDARHDQRDPHGPPDDGVSIVAGSGGVLADGVRLLPFHDDRDLAAAEHAAARAAEPRPGDLDLIALDRALDRLARVDVRQSRLVELRFFAGLTVEETAHVLGVAPITVKRDWALARAWLYRELQGREPPDREPHDREAGDREPEGTQEPR